MATLELLENPFVRRWADFYDESDLLSHFSEDVLSTLPELFDYPNVVLHGGAGTGKTMLFRYLSYEVQKLLFSQSGAENQAIGDLADFSANRVKAKIGKGVPYLGFYRKLTEIPADHFSNVVSTDDGQCQLFRYYLNLELSIKFLSCIQSLIDSSSPEEIKLEVNKQFIVHLQTMTETHSLASITDVLELLVKRKREIDGFLATVEIGERSANDNFNVTVSPVGLVNPLFQLVQCVKQAHPAFQHARFFVLLDEYEKIATKYKRVVNSLIMERNRSVEFKIGSRRYGLETLETVATGDALIIGRDIELLDLEYIFLHNKAKYRKLLEDAARRRLIAVAPSGKPAKTNIRKILASQSLVNQALDIVKKKGTRKVPVHRQRFQRFLKNSGQSNVKETMASIMCNRDPIAEMLNMLLVKRRVASETGRRRYPQTFTNAQIQSMCKEFMDSRGETSRYHWLYKKNKSALLFQLASYYGHTGAKRKYAGFIDYAQLSGGFIHIFLSLCYAAFAAAKDDESFHKSNIIGVDAQNRAAIEVSQDYIRKGVRNFPGHGTDLYYFVLNLGAFFRALHRDELLREPEPTYFITAASKLGPKLSRFLALAHQWSILQSREPMIPRKVGEPLPEVHVLHPIFAPAFHISFVVRGRTKLSVDQVECLVSGDESSVTELAKEFLGGRKARPENSGPDQEELFSDNR